MMIRKAAEGDIEAVVKLYKDIHTAEEMGKRTTGWGRGVYPVRATAERAVKRKDLFVLEDDGSIRGAGIINGRQDESYSRAQWQYPAADNQVCVLHTLVISPEHSGKGYGRAFLGFYEQYAKKTGCLALRLDTNVINTAARAFYAKHGYREIGIVPTRFQGIPDVKLVLLEKHL